MTSAGTAISHRSVINIELTSIDPPSTRHAMPRDSDTSSLHTLPESLRETLYEYRGERRYNTLSEDYTLSAQEERAPWSWPCDSTASRLELVNAAIGSKIYANGLYWEEYPGALDEVLNRGKEHGPTRICDLGSGLTATWCVSMAEKFPEAEVVGIDLTPSELLYLPSNLTIEIHDLLEGIPSPDDWYDLIHCRYGGMTAFLDNPHADLMAEVARALKPGGVVILEMLHDVSNPVCSRTPNNPIASIINDRQKLAPANSDMLHGLSDIARHAQLEASWARRVMTDGTSFTNARTTQIELPVGWRAGEGPPERQLGSLVRDASFLFSELHRAGGGLDEDAIRELRTLDRTILPEVDIGLYIPFDTVWGEKPR